MEAEEESSLALPEPGDLVWAKIEGHPWWPSIVNICPESLTHVKGVKGSSLIHVYFYDTPTSRSWIKAKYWRPFQGKNAECEKGGLYYSSKKSFHNAMVKADKAYAMTVERHPEVSKGRNELWECIEYLQERLEDFSKKKDEKRGRKRKIQEDSEDYESSSSPVKQAKVMPEPIASTSSACPSPELTKLKKKNRPGPLSFKKSLGIVINEQETYKVDDADIPQSWKTPFVLMKACEIPVNLRATLQTGDRPTSGKPKQMKAKPTAEDNEEEDIVDSDEDPGWNPKGDEVDEDDDTVLDDSDDDPGWQPSKKKGAKTPVPKSTKKLGVKGRKKTNSSVQPKTSLKHSDPKAAKSPTPIAPRPAASETIDPRNNPQPILVPPDAPAGVTPEIGNFLYEKSEYNGGNMPFLWKYKRSGLIQKYGRVVENGKVMYESLLSFSDWWACYAHKYELIKVRVMFRYKTTEKVAILELPDGQPPANAGQVSENTAATDSGQSETAQSETSQSETSVANSEQTSVDNTQEEEISSTTPEVELYQTGKFVLDMKEQRNVDNFAIWKIESNILLKKFEAVVKNGRFLHKAVKTYRGYKDIAKSYLPIKVKVVCEIPGDEYVEVTEESRPKLSANASNSECYDNNPLLRHFYVYLQVFLSQALEPGFLDEIKKTKDSTYTFPLGEIDKLIKQKAINVERKAKWTPKIKNALAKCPYLREVPKPDDKKFCEAITDSTETVEETLFLFGSEYDTDTLKQSGSSLPCQEFRIGETAISLVSSYHQLCHFKYNLYDRCLAKIKVVQETSKEDLEITDIMDKCLGNKAWVVQNFEDFMKLVELV